jgi:hypothetical protein
VCKPQSRNVTHESYLKDSLICVEAGVKRVKLTRWLYQDEFMALPLHQETIWFQLRLL